MPFLKRKPKQEVVNKEPVEKPIEEISANDVENYLNSVYGHQMSEYSDEDLIINFRSKLRRLHFLETAFKSKSRLTEYASDGKNTIDKHEHKSEAELLQHQIEVIKAILIFRGSDAKETIMELKEIEKNTIEEDGYRYYFT